MRLSKALQGTEVFIVDALRFEPHATHFHVEAALAAIERVKPRQAFLTHVCHDLEHVATSAALPEGVDLAYDGLRIRSSFEPKAKYRPRFCP
ncbi:MAG: hypothetical protein R3C53_11760 [Pirellulaceae bacterium]